MKFNRILFLFLFSLIGNPAVGAISIPDVSTTTYNSDNKEIVVTIYKNSFSSAVVDSDLAGISCSGCRPTLMVNIGESNHFAIMGLMSEAVKASPSTTFADLKKMLQFAGYPTGVKAYSIDVKKELEWYETNRGPLGGVHICAAVVWSTVQQSGTNPVPVGSQGDFPYPNAPGATSARFACSSGGATIPDDSCTLDNSSLNVDFGTLTSDEIENKKKSTSFKVKCGKSAYATIALASGANSIVLSNGVVASLDVDNKKLGSNFTMQKGTASHTLNVRLSGATSKLGAFTGSGTLNINVQ